MITLMQVIQELRPGAQSRIIGDTYNDITWDDKNQTIPTEDEVDKKLKELQEGEPMALLREERNILLSETDWMVIKSQETGVAMSDAWKTYRQALRDLPASSTPSLDANYDLDLTSVTWPTKPS